MSTDILLDDKQITVIGDLVIRNTNSNDGDIFVEDGDGNRSIHLGGNDASLELGSKGSDHGDVSIYDAEGNQTIHLGGNDARLKLGGDENRDGSDGDLILQTKVGEPAIQLDAQGDGPEDPETTSIYADGKKGSLHFRPVKHSEGTSNPLIYMLSGPIGGGPRSWSSDLFPDRVPVIVHSPSYPQDGLIWDNNENQFVFQQVRMEVGETELDPNPNDLNYSRLVPTIESETKHALTIDLNEPQVGINTNNPSHTLDVNGNINANNVEIPSDVRYKKNIESITGGLEKVRNIRGVRYEWDNNEIEKREFDSEQHLGFIAQELEEELPEVVSGVENGFKTTRQSEITPVLVEAIKDQQELIDEQQELIDNQKDMLVKLESRIEKLENLIQ